MNESLKRILTVTIVIQVLILSNFFAVKSDQPVIASRIEEISEIAIIDLSFQSSSTLFGIKTKVEILNRGEENQTITESCILDPQVFVNASFEDKSLELNSIGWCGDMFISYSYAPGITVEYEVVKFYINQTDLTQLPDGNYIFWRPIPSTGVRPGNVVGEAFPTIITVNSGMIEIIYHSFYYDRTEEVSSENNNHDTEETYFSLVVQIICFFILQCIVIVYKRIKTRIV